MLCALNIISVDYSEACWAVSWSDKISNEKLFLFVLEMQ